MDRLARMSSLGLLLVAAAGCGQAEPQPEVVPQTEDIREGGDLVTGTGTIVRHEIEGGFYAIRADDGTTYDPTNLPAEFRTDGLRVYFEGRLRTDLMSTHMVGPLIEIDTIRPVQSDSS